MKKEFRVIEGKLVTGHVNRHGEFVDIRPVRVGVPYHVYDDSLNSPITVYLYTTKDVVIEDCPNIKYFGYSYHTDARILEFSADYITRLRIEFGDENFYDWEVKIPIKKKSEFNKAVELNKLHQKNWEIVKEQLFRQFPELMEQLADKYLEEQPKQARRYSSGRNNLDVIQDFYVLLRELPPIILDGYEYQYAGCLSDQAAILRKIPEEIKNLLARKIQQRKVGA